MTNPRLIIGKHQISPFAGCSDGDIFADLSGNRWQLYCCSGGWTLRPEGQRLSPAMPGFEQIDGWLDLASRINNACLNAVTYDR